MDKKNTRKKRSLSNSTRPYDRSDQGLLGKVASKVKGLLYPSWLSQWMSGDDPPPDEEEEEMPQSYKRPRLEKCSILSEGTQTWMDMPSTSNSFCPPPAVIQRTLEDKEPVAIMNGDDHSENSEGSASTSGCSSLVSHKDRSHIIPGRYTELDNMLKGDIRVKRRRITADKDCPSSSNTSRLSVWSSSGYTPSSKLQGRSPSVTQGNVPGFSINTFVGTSKCDKRVSSPFYQGRTSFGGASSVSKLHVAPYQVDKPLRNQIRVQAKQSESPSDHMSSAAKRILQTLEKMSSPITDAKKIPNTDKPPVDLSLYLMPPKHRSNVPCSPVSNSRGPIIADISTISKLTTLKSFGLRRSQNTNLDSLPVDSHRKNAIWLDNINQDITSNYSAANQKSGGGKMRNKKTQVHQPSAGIQNDEPLEPVSLSNIPLPISTLPTFNFDTKPCSNASEAKMSSQDFTFSNPIHLTKVLDDIFNPTPGTPKNTSSTNNDRFKFSSPLDDPLLNIYDNTPISKASTFSFAPPDPPPFCKSSGLLNLGSVDDFLAMNRRKVEETGNKDSWSSGENPVPPSGSNDITASEAPVSRVAPSASAFSLANSETVKVKTPATDSSTKPSVPRWKCDTCFVSNLVGQSKCLACETPQPSEQNSGFNNRDSFKFCSPLQSSPITFDKMVDIKLPSTKPQSTPFTLSGPFNTGTLQPSPFKELFTDEPLVNEKCPVVEKTSDASILKTSAFSTATAETKPESAKSTEDVAVSKPNAFPTNVGLFPGLSTSNQWECGTCMVRNASDKDKCVACEAQKPTTSSTAGNFKFDIKKDTSNVNTIAATSTAALFPIVTTSSPALPSSQPTDGFTFKMPAAVKSIPVPVTSPAEEKKPALSITSLPASGFCAPNQWECKTCMVRNTADKDKCIACEAPKPGVATSQPTGGFNFSALPTDSTTPFKLGSTTALSTTTTTSSSTPSVLFGSTSITTSTTSTPFPFGNLSTQSPIGGFNFKPPTTAKPSDPPPPKDESKTFSFPKEEEKGENKPATMFGSGFKLPDKTSDNNKSMFATTSTASAFKFGTTPASTFSMPTSQPAGGIQLGTPAFGFGTAAPTTTQSASNSGTMQPATNSGFSFFNSTATTTTATVTPNLFTFGASSGSQQTTATTGGFAFKGTEDVKPNVNSVSNSINFGMPATTSASSVFKFGTTSTPSTTGFSFGTVKSEPAFSFGQGPQTTATPSVFSGFQPNQSAATPASVFQFGANQPGNPAPSIPFGGANNSFSFGGMKTDPLHAATPQAPTFNSSSMQSMFGNTAAAPAFGNSDAKQGFNFGNPAAASTAPLFQFGGSAEKKQATGSTPQYNFSAIPPASFPAQFNPSTPLSFNFAGSQAGGAAPFQFAASNDVNPSSQQQPRRIRKALRRTKHQ